MDSLLFLKNFQKICLRKEKHWEFASCYFMVKGKGGFNAFFSKEMKNPISPKKRQKLQQCTSSSMERWTNVYSTEMCNEVWKAAFEEFLEES